jgi:hypothetical protein
MKKLISIFLLSISPLVVASDDITSKLNGAILSDSTNSNCAVYMQADDTHAGYGLFAVIPPSAQNSENYDCENGKFRSCKGQSIGYVKCYNTGLCTTSEWVEFFSFDANEYNNFKHVPSGTALTYSQNTYPNFCK